MTVVDGLELDDWLAAAEVEDVREVDDPELRAAWVAAHPDWPDLLRSWEKVTLHILEGDICVNVDA